MTMLNLDLLQITENFSKLAGELGADQDAAAVTEAKTAFEASAQRVRDAVGRREPMMLPTPSEPAKRERSEDVAPKMRRARRQR